MSAALPKAFTEATKLAQNLLDTVRAEHAKAYPYVPTGGAPPAAAAGPPGYGTAPPVAVGGPPGYGAPPQPYGAYGYPPPGAAPYAYPPPGAGARLVWNKLFLRGSSKSFMEVKPAVDAACSSQMRLEQGLGVLVPVFDPHQLQVQHL